MPHPSGFSEGFLSKLMKDLSSWAGMAAVMCATASAYGVAASSQEGRGGHHAPRGGGGWWQLSEVLMILSQQASAGVKPELLKLMEVGGVEVGTRAAAIWRGRIV